MAYGSCIECGCSYAECECSNHTVKVPVLTSKHYFFPREPRTISPVPTFLIPCNGHDQCSICRMLQEARLGDRELGRWADDGGPP